MRILLDTTPLWLLVHPAGGPKALALRRKLLSRLGEGDHVAVAAICDYEARRELMRRRAARQLRNLDLLLGDCLYLPITTAALHRAAELWADSRRVGRPTATDPALDGDVILAALATEVPDHLVVTTNLSHLGRLCRSRDLDDFLAT